MTRAWQRAVSHRYQLTLHVPTASEQVAQAMVARGYRSPESQTLYLGLDDDALLSADTRI
eukprot:CAMPEP_0119160912 /NCGR_PEP_ID=MMETSP1315-20130426/813_1 /TAXON_ID=676789 /ORGANISM="Prasinoderma singularis, Strain RCC927" /LENGTH=59 /DNA_ID=CAMNT_0007153585 /DNA_START=56 /DNA_END=233 /DNA_ORIENTATION=-